MPKAKKKTKRKVGRPTDYSPAMIKAADKYLKERQDEFSDWIKTDGNTSTTYERKVTVRLPSHEDFADYIGKHPDTLYEWARKHPEFSVSLDKIKREQKKRLINSGLSGDYNPTIAKLILSSNHGMKERSDVTTDDEKVVTVAGFQYVTPDNKTNNNPDV